MNRLRTALATAAAAALGLAALATAPAQAAAQPAFLAASQMPPSSTPWTATQVFSGVPENGGVLCAPYKIPAQNTRYREFSTELDTNGVQVTTVARTEADAVKLVDTLRKALMRLRTPARAAEPGPGRRQRVPRQARRRGGRLGLQPGHRRPADRQHRHPPLLRRPRRPHRHPRPLGPDGGSQGRPADGLQGDDEDRRQQALAVTDSERP